MDIESFIEGPLLWIVFSALLIGILSRFIFFLFSIFKSNKYRSLKTKFVFTSLGRFFVPLHKAFLKKPLYTLLRYIFHVCIIIVPVAFSGHIVMWESSFLGITWPSIPDLWADVMTLVFIGLCGLFLMRRIVFPEVRRKSSAFDYLFIVICLLPFLNGYFLTHGTLDSISFFYNHMFTIHILSGSVMIIMVVVLFVRSRLDNKLCTGCAACQVNCPTETLNYYDKENQRIFEYSHYLCVSCGECIHTCPEDAAELRHMVGLKPFFQILKKEEIQSVELKTCRTCGLFFAPEPQLEKITQSIEEDYLFDCPKCKQKHAADTFHQLSPWAMRSHR